MSAERPITWLAGAAAVVGLFVAFAARDSGRPSTMVLTAETRQVHFAPTQSQAVAKAEALNKSIPTVRVLAAVKKPVVPKARLSRDLPVQAQIAAAAPVFATAMAPVSAASALLRDLAANDRAYDSQCLVPTATVAPLAIASFVPIAMDVLSTARSLRGPPALAAHAASATVLAAYAAPAT